MLPGLMPMPGLHGASWSPSLLPSIALWLDASSNVYTDTGGTTPAVNNDDLVALWKDQSGNGRNYSQATSGNRPLLKTAVLNGRRVINFAAASSQELIGPSFASLTAGDGFIVVKADADPPGGSIGLWTFGSTGDVGLYPYYADANIYEEFGTTARKVYNPTPSLASWRLYNVISTSTEFTALLDGTQVYTTATNTVAFPTATRVGSSYDVGIGTNYLSGQIAEVVICGAKLSAADRSALKSYFASKYAMTIA